MTFMYHIASQWNLFLLFRGSVRVFPLKFSCLDCLAGNFSDIGYTIKLNKAMDPHKLTEVSSSKSFGGFQKIFSHQSDVLKTVSRFSIYFPPGVDAEDKKFPLVYFLSGLTCTEENFIQKSGIQGLAAKHGLVVVGPDTSPRGCNIEGDKDSWAFGEGAGFYVDAAEDKWKTNYNMYSYVTRELPEVIAVNFCFVDNSKQSIMGHSMGGHGALICSLKNPGKYRAVSAFAPICNPINSPWGKNVFGGYMGADQELWKQYDACELAKNYKGPSLPVLIDQGSDDKFYKEKQLLPENLTSAASNTNVQINLRFQEGYDHGYFFIASFLESHMEFHAKELTASV